MDIRDMFKESQREIDKIIGVRMPEGQQVIDLLDITLEQEVAASNVVNDDSDMDVIADDGEVKLKVSTMLDDICERIDLDRSTALYVALNKALRITASYVEQLQNAAEMEPKEWMSLFASVWVSGLFTGIEFEQKRRRGN